MDISALYEALARVLEQKENVKINFIVEEVIYEENSGN